MELTLTTGNVSRRIFAFAWPLLVGNVFQQLYNVADSIIVGRFLGKEALAGMVAAAQIPMIVISLVVGIGIGGTVVAAQFYGAGNIEKVRRTCDTVTLFMLAASLVLGVVGILCCDKILRLICMPAEAVRYAKPFLYVYFGGMFTMFGYNATSSVLRGIGDSTTPLYALVVASVVNIVLDLLFILVLGGGTGAAALATVIAQGASWLFIIVYAKRKEMLLSFNFFRAKFDVRIFRQTLRIGLPSGFQQSFVAIGMAALFGIINTFGVDVAAAYGAATRIELFATLPAVTFSMALSTFVGQNIGAGNMIRVRAGLRSTLIMTGGATLAISLLAVVLRRPFIGFFTDANLNASLVNIGAQYMAIVGPFYLVFAFMFVLNGLQRGAGASFVPMLITLMSLWVVRIPVAYLLSRSSALGYVGTFWAIPIAWGIGLLLSLAYYFSGWWKGKAIF